MKRSVSTAAAMCAGSRPFDFFAPFATIDAALPLTGNLNLSIGAGIEEFVYPDAANTDAAAAMTTPRTSALCSIPSLAAPLPMTVLALTTTPAILFSPM
jgi:hypothetical protein